MFHCLQLQEILRPRQQMRAFMSMWRMDIRIQPYVIRSGFYGIYRLGHIAIDWPLITALVERWRPETHTFHVLVGEMTITLQDVAILLGLRIHGPAVTGTCVFDVAVLCADLLGRTLHITFHTPTDLHVCTLSGVHRANLHSIRYPIIVTPFTIPYIASHR